MEIAFWIEGDFAFCIRKHDVIGHLCGYLGVAPRHPWYEKDYEEIEANVHGGLTFASHEWIARRPNGAWLKWLRAGGIGDPPLGRQDVPRKKPYPHDTGLSLWWVGFDCGHYGDAVPGISLRGVPTLSGGIYRDENFVRAELQRLAAQAAEAVQANSQKVEMKEEWNANQGNLRQGENATPGQNTPGG